MQIKANGQIHHRLKKKEIAVHPFKESNLIMFLKIVN